MLRGASVAVASPRDRRRSWAKLLARAPVWFLVPTAGALAGFAVYPLFVLARMSVSDVGPANIVGDWPFVGSANFVAVLEGSELYSAAARTVVLTGIILASNFVLGFLGASILSTAGRITGSVLTLLVFMWALPPIVSGSAWKFLLNDSGPVNGALQAVGLEPIAWLSSPQLALYSISAVIAWAALPFSILVIRGSLLAVPRSVVEAAALDGAGYWRTQLQIVLPHLRPTFAILGILTVLYAFKSFDFFYVVTQGGPGTSTTTLPVLAYNNAFNGFQMSTGATVAVVAMLLVALVAVPYVRSVRREEEISE